MTILKDLQAPTRYDYQIDVEGGIILKPADDGAIAPEGPDGSSRGMILEYVNPIGDHQAGLIRDHELTHVG